MTTPAKPASDTPRTDAADKFSAIDYQRNSDIHCVRADLARQLERENAELREALKFIAFEPEMDANGLRECARAILARTAQGKEQG